MVPWIPPRVANRITIGNQVSSRTLAEGAIISSVTFWTSNWKATISAPSSNIASHGRIKTFYWKFLFAFPMAVLCMLGESTQYSAPVSTS